MIDRLLENLAPHYCYGCGIIGTVLCNDCKYNIVDEPYDGCLACGRLGGDLGVCRQCRVPYQRAWCGVERSGVAEAILNAYKFSQVRSGHVPLADMLLSRLPELPASTIVVPVPTIAPHIRQRGYDHTMVLAKYIGRRRGLRVCPFLGRATTSVQRGANRAARMAQAQEAFTIRSPLPTNGPYLLIDDVVTTGATVRAAAQSLREAGADEVWVGAIMRQPLD